MPRSTKKLSQYAKKRNFKDTPEPSDASTSTGSSKLRFVVQKHHATQLHYDFRLEVHGVMKSWAVPKGPVLNPTVKRLAMEVEDHPLEYRNFEGTIPEGNYGAGIVMIWDEGTYEPLHLLPKKDAQDTIAQQYKDGQIKIRLFGKKLQGEFALVRMKKDKKPMWLLIKHDDEGAHQEIPNEDQSVHSGRTLEEIAAGEKPKELTWPKAHPSATKTVLTKAPLPRMVKPMLATLTEEHFTHPDWSYELKWDGYRALAEVHKGKVKLYSRNGLDFTERYADITSALKKMKGTVLLDGEVVVVDDKGIAKFQYLQQYPDQPEHQLLYYVFDILYFDHYDLRPLPFTERRKVLEKILKPAKHIRVSEVYPDGLQLLAGAKELGMEGVIAKRKDSPYERGRSAHWLKFKVVQEREFVIGGYTHPKGDRKGFGSLLLGEYRNDRFVYVGHAGTGFDDKKLTELQSKMDRYATKKGPFAPHAQLKERTVAQWIKPKLVAQVKFSEWTSDGVLRHPVFVGLREDKHASEVRPEPVTKETKPLQPQTVEITHPDKVYWPKEGYTKQDLLDYYASIADTMLPYLKDRPQNLNRHPSGINGESFYHKDFEQSHPPWLKTIDVYSESAGEDISYVVCQNKETLLYLANLGCIEINTWNSRIQHLKYPDYLIFDLDPNDLDFSAVVHVALALHQLLDAAKIPNYCKTSGKRGLHVFVPLGTKYNFDQVKLFVKLIALKLQAQLPDIISLERRPDDRKGKIYIDYLQNRFGQTTVCAYSVRPVPGATVSTPLEWSEVNDKLNPKQFTIKTTLARIKRKGDLWKPVLSLKLDMRKALARIETL